MNSTQENSREHFQQAIDAEIQSLEEYTRALKLRRNALSPVSSLPAEVFCTIFSMLCLPGTSSLDGSPDHHLSQLHLSHVCHQWREIALNQPLLWSHVNFTTLSSAGTTEILVRAKSAPLYLEANLSGFHWDDVQFSTFRKELQARVPHLRRLATSAGPMFLEKTLEECLSSAPILEHLSLSSRGIHKDRKKWARISIPDTLFNGSTPRLSCLELSYCDISWESPLLKGLKNLEIITPNTTKRPELAVWLGALDEMPQLVTLTLHSASPIAPSVPFDAKRTATLPSLTHLNILSDPRDCALALAHLDLPALTSLCLRAISWRLPNISDMESLLPHIARHSHGPQDTQPLQSMLICSQINQADVLAWPEPDIDLNVHDPTTLLAKTRVALSFSIEGCKWLPPDQRLEILGNLMEGLPLNGLVTLATHDEKTSRRERNHPTEHFWLHFSPKWPLLKRVRLAPIVTRGFFATLLKDRGTLEGPFLPSLTELTVVGSSLSALSKYPLFDALVKREQQGVRVETLDLRMCTPFSPRQAKAWLLSLTGVVHTLHPEEASKESDKMKSKWKTVARGRFIDNDSSGDDYSDSADSSDDEDDHSDDAYDWEMERDVYYGQTEHYW